MPDRRAEIRDAYDSIAEEHDAHRSAVPPELSLVEELADELPADAHVLDAGCGAGDPVAALLAERVEVTGLDFSAAQLDIARRRAPAANLVRGEMTHLPFAGGTFDGLCSIYAVIHVPWESHRACFAEFRRVLGAGAPLLVTVGTTDWTGSNDDWMGMGEPMHWEIPGLERTTELLEAVGFDVESHETVVDDVSEEEGVKAFVRARAR